MSAVRCGWDGTDCDSCRFSCEERQCSHWMGGTLQLRRQRGRLEAYCFVCGWVDRTD